MGPLKCLVLTDKSHYESSFFQIRGRMKSRLKNYQYISISSPVHTKSNGSFRVNAAGNALLFTFHLQHRFIRFCSFGYILSDMFLVRSVLSSVYLPPLVQVMFCLQSYLYFVYGSIYVLCKLCSVASVPSMAWPMSSCLLSWDLAMLHL